MKLLILDIDGVLTDGTKMYGPDGKVFGKRFCDHDWTAIKKFKMDGWVVVLLSADKNINEVVAKDREIAFYYSRLTDGTIDKVAWYRQLIHRYVVSPEDVVYVGDDLLDLPVMQAVATGGGRVYCPLNAIPQFVNGTALSEIGVLNRRGGEGAVMALYHLYNPTSHTPPVH